MADDAPDLARIAAALERLAPAPFRADLSTAAAFRWAPAQAALLPAPAFAGPPLDLLLGVERQKDALVSNTRRFAAGAPANNALLWGSRGTGKSALIKATHAAIAAAAPTLKLVEAPPSDLDRIGALIDALRAQPHPVILFLDDLSFAGGEAALKALKPALDGALNSGEGRLLVYATSNRRHLVARDARENLPDEIMWADAAEEHLALADRFGLWLGFHAMDQNAYLAIIDAYAARFKLPIAQEKLHEEALLWSRTRAARSGRTAWQFTLDLAGRLDRPVKF
ncbi:MAG TPA: ATP-binding protein [Caulobacterales bacterium]|nr:ATP-binding protein [Caulobacterales bacterium]